MPLCLNNKERGKSVMPLVNTRNLIENAVVNEYAVPAFNIYNLECAQAVLNAAKELNAPVILQLYRRLFESDMGGSLAAAIQYLAGKMSIPVALHLDHGSSECDCIRALRAGCVSVMIDGSALDFNENVRLTAGIVKSCGYADVLVEGELGHVGSAYANDESNLEAYTEPRDAEEFCKKTGVSMLAVMVGSAHGRYKKAPKLDIDRIKEISRCTGVPLVLHGGSGIPDQEIREAVQAGIRKINVATDVCQAYYEGFRHLGPENPKYELALDVFAKPSIELVQNFAKEKISLFGAAGRYQW